MRQYLETFSFGKAATKTAFSAASKVLWLITARAANKREADEDADADADAETQARKPH